MALQEGTATTDDTVLNVNMSSKKNTIIAAICALLNSGGGVLNICCDTKKTTMDCVRTVEQNVKGAIGVAGMRKYIHIVVCQEQQKIIVNVKGSNKLFTVNYNLYLPGQSEINPIDSTTGTEDIKEILHKKLVEACVTIASHKKDWEVGKHCGLQEGDDVQFKTVENAPSKRVTLADRVVANKLSCYISAFANHRGGHIYYGISDQGQVKGQQVKTNNIYKLTFIAA